MKKYCYFKSVFVAIELYNTQRHKSVTQDCLGNMTSTSKFLDLKVFYNASTI